MDIKENLINALKGREVEKTPVAAFPSVLTTQLLSQAHASFDEAIHNPEIMAQIAGLIYEQTHLEAITIPLDMWFESESMGHFMERNEGSLTPVITEAPFESPEDIEIPDDVLSTGQFPAIEKATRILHEKYDDKDVPIIGGITGGFTMLTDLVDLGKIIKMLNSDYMEIEDALEELNKISLEEIEFYQEIGVDCIVVNDPSSTAKIIKPQLFEDLVQPFLEELSDAMDVPGVLHICGDTNSNLEYMLSCGFEGLSISQEVDITYARQIRQQVGSDTVICGNLAIGDTLLMKDVEGVKQDSFKCLDKNVDILGPSCNIAYETPLSNIRAMVEARDEYFQLKN